MNDLNKEKNEVSTSNIRQNIGMVSLISVLCIIIVVLINLLLFLPNNNKQIMVSSKNTKGTEAYSSNNTTLVEIPQTYFIGKKISTTFANISSTNDIVPIPEPNNNHYYNNVNTNTAIPIPPLLNTNISNTTYIPDVTGGTDSNVLDNPSNTSGVNFILNNNTGNNSTTNNTIPDSYGGSEIVKLDTTIHLNDVAHKVNVYCECSIIDSIEYAPNEFYYVYNNHYSITVDRNECKNIKDVSSILPDNPKTEDCFAITKITDRISKKDYLVIQTFANQISGRKTTIYILDNNLRILGIVEHDGRTSYTINGELKELTINSDYISDYSLHNDEFIDHIYNIQDGKNDGVAHHIYSIQDGKFVDNIDKIYKKGEYTASGRT